MRAAARASAEDLDAGRFEPPCPRCGRALMAMAVPEDAPLDPRNVYAATKVAQEHLCAAFARETGATVTALRYHNVYGPRMPRDTPYAGVASIFRSALAAGRAPRVFEDGAQRRDFVHVRDVAAANVLALDAASPGVFNVASGTPRTVGEMADALARAIDGPHPQVTGEWRAGDVRHVFASPEAGGHRARLPRRGGLRGRHARVRDRGAARVTRFAVVGHVEWIEFGVFTHVPEPGEIIDARGVVLRGRRERGGGRRPARETVRRRRLLHGAGRRRARAAVRGAIDELGVRVHAAPREDMQRWAFVHLDDDGERTISVVGERHAPHGDDDLPWERLDGADAVFVSGGDHGAMEQARRAKLLVATPRAVETLGGSGSMP